MATPYPMMNPLLPQAQLSPEQLRMMQGRASLSGVAAMLGASRPGANSNMAIGRGIAAMMGDYDTMAQTALAAQVYKQGQEHQKRQDERADRQEKRLEEQQAQNKTFREQQMAMETARMAETVRQNQRMYDQAVKSGNMSAAVAAERMRQLTYFKDHWPELRGQMEAAGATPEQIKVAEISGMSGGGMGPVMNVLSPTTVEQVPNWPGAMQINTPQGPKFVQPPSNPFASLMGNPMMGENPGGVPGGPMSPTPSGPPATIQEGIQQDETAARAAEVKKQQEQAIRYGRDVVTTIDMQAGGTESNYQSVVDQLSPRMVDKLYQSLQEAWVGIPADQKPKAKKLFQLLEKRRSAAGGAK